MRLLVVTDRSQLPLGRSLLATVGACIEAGATHVLLRELDLAPARRAALAQALVDLGATVISAHHPLPAAIGVHGPGGIGRSCHASEEVHVAAAEGASYATLSPFATTESKPGYGPPLPEDAFVGLPIPTLALGGITPSTATLARERRAHGVAVMGHLMRAADPGEQTAVLLEAVR